MCKRRYLPYRMSLCAACIRRRRRCGCALCLIAERERIKRIKQGPAVIAPAAGDPATR